MMDYMYSETYVRDLQTENKEVIEENIRLKLAAAGRGMVSEMADMSEVVVLVCGLHDKIDYLEKRNSDLYKEVISKNTYIEKLQANIAKLNSQIIVLQIDRDKSAMQAMILQDVLNNKDNIVEI